MWGHDASTTWKPPSVGNTAKRRPSGAPTVQAADLVRGYEDGKLAGVARYREKISELGV